MSNRGRPEKFTPERRAAIIDSIAHRIPYELAAEANGITEECLYQWLRRGKKDKNAGLDTPHAEFFQAIKETEQKKIKEHLETLREKPERWQADAWILERRWWKYFSPNAAVIEFNKRLDAMESKEDEIDSREEKKDSEK